MLSCVVSAMYNHDQHPQQAVLPTYLPASSAIHLRHAYHRRQAAAEPVVHGVRPTQGRHAAECGQLRARRGRRSDVQRQQERAVLRNPQSHHPDHRPAEHVDGLHGQRVEDRPAGPSQVSDQSTRSQRERLLQRGLVPTGRRRSGERDPRASWASIERARPSKTPGATHQWRQSRSARESWPRNGPMCADPRAPNM
jgi:hypothetical protein